MRYKPLSFIVIVVALLFIVFDSSQFLRYQTLHLTDKIKFWFFDTKEDIKLSYTKYIHQAQNIEKYEEKLKNYGQLELQLQAAQTQLTQLSEFLNKEITYQSPDFIATKAFSYVGMGDYDRIWMDLDTSSYPKNKIFGIVQNGNALGIAIIKNNRLMGLLNGNENCSYAVYVGKQKIPAIIRYDSSDPQKILADFIPAWLKVNVGDEVVTSGLDGVFTPNIKVGKITSVIQNYGYNTAELSPYAQKKDLSYMWLIDTKILQSNFGFNNSENK
ncbi:rod shape-determining protein MreC [Helicobacter cappadocius]|uniref:Rod shape-determining protein MreC n=1 Tax=Helicobacter cappadocius TaxID=3063998 RepID=A0AA90TE96_9HELI|nr:MULTISPECIES: rod shape-determining protein MreC [unclassified Helicobacter]MDO7252503.1 rod shape-determining protein MreC [Helicobacter sp. faydin-H75]MDP2538370.1 rod shape-determining protein MreC [Helicobacter sp. faydin-H76]